MERLHVTSVRFAHYKAFRTFALHLHDFNVLVGPNNAGKSTIIGAFRILHEGLRKARAKSPDRVEIDGTVTLGYKLSIEDLPVAAENIFHNYDESQPARVTFSLSNGNTLSLHFPERGLCIMVPESAGRYVRSPKDFRAAFNLEIAFVPILGPVEQREPLFAKEAARRALLTSGASRNFRNIWYHYPEGFDRFRELVQSTWPGMDIGKPELGGSGQELLMFCPEERLPREICWAGYGFQVWCQMLTFIVKGSDASLLVIDEPDIYLHSDLQRQLVALLRNLGPDIVIATHSTEIISECDPSSLLNVDKRTAVATRVKDPSQLKRVFAALGSNLNPTLTQLAKTRRVVLVEGPVFQVLSPIARAMGRQRVANRADFAVIHAERLDARRAVDLVSGVEKTLGRRVLCVVILSRGYRSDQEISETLGGLVASGLRAEVMERNEIDNYLLVPDAIERAFKGRLSDRSSRAGGLPTSAPDIKVLLREVLERFRHEVSANMIARHADYMRQQSSAVHQASINESVLRDIEVKWSAPEGPTLMAPGGEVLTRLNETLQEGFGITLADTQIAAEIRRAEIPEDIARLIDLLERFGTEEVPESGERPGGSVDAPGRTHDDVKETLKRKDAAISSHRAIESGADWEEVPATLPASGIRR